MRVLALCLLLACASLCASAAESVVPLSLRTADGLLNPTLVLKPAPGGGWSVEVEVWGGVYVGRGELVGGADGDVQRIVISGLQPSKERPPYPGFAPARIQLEVKGDRARATVFNAAGQPIGRGKGKAYTRDPEARSKALTTPLLPYRSFMNSDTMAQALALRQAIEQLREGVATEVVLQAMQRDQGKYPVFAPAASSLRWGLENGQLETVLRDLEMQIGSRKPPARPN